MRFAVVDAIRTAVGKKDNFFKNIDRESLSLTVIKEILYRNKLNFDEYNLFISNNNISKNIIFRSELDERITTCTIHDNKLSDMLSFTTAMDKITINNKNVVLVSGICLNSNISREIDNSNICVSEKLIKDFNINRLELDRCAVKSYEKYKKSLDSGAFNKEIFPIINSNDNLVIHDDYRKLALNIISEDKSILHNCSVTNSNISHKNSGAFVSILMSEEEAKKRNIKPLGYISDYLYRGYPLSLAGVAPAVAIKDVLRKNNLCLNDIDLFEIDESSSSILISNIRAIASKKFAKDNFIDSTPVGNIDESIVNINGGDLTIGSVDGVSGGRMLIHSLYELERRGLNRAIVTLGNNFAEASCMVLEIE